jgi:hypothetical protein
MPGALIAQCANEILNRVHRVGEPQSGGRNGKPGRVIGDPDVGCGGYAKSATEADAANQGDDRNWAGAYCSEGGRIARFVDPCRGCVPAQRFELANVRASREIKASGSLV